MPCTCQRVWSVSALAQSRPEIRKLVNKYRSAVPWNIGHFLEEPSSLLKLSSVHICQQTFCNGFPSISTRNGFYAISILGITDRMYWMLLLYFFKLRFRLPEWWRWWSSSLAFPMMAYSDTCNKIFLIWWNMVRAMGIPAWFLSLLSFWTTYSVHFLLTVELVSQATVLIQFDNNQLPKLSCYID